MAFGLQRFQDQRGESTIIPQLTEIGITPKIIETRSRTLRHLIWYAVTTVGATYNFWIKLYNSVSTITSGTTEPFLVWPVEVISTATILNWDGGIIWEKDDVRPVFTSGITAVVSGQAGNLFTSIPANLTVNLDLGVI
jgi:hypothetical protein